MSSVATSSVTCHNCGAWLTGPFCASCGQKTAPLDPTVHDFLHDFSHEMLHVDGRLYRSVWMLLVSPGFLTREQFLGRRARWISPIRPYRERWSRQRRYFYAVLAFRVAFAASFWAALGRMTAVVIVYFVLVGASASALAMAVIFWSR